MGSKNQGQTFHVLLSLWRHLGFSWTTHTHTPISKRNSNKLEGHKAWFYLHLIDYNSAREDTNVF